jgi:hypothetical protein
MGLFGVEGRTANTKMMAARLGGRGEVLPFIVQRNGLADWPETSLALRRVVASAPEASRMHDGIEPGRLYPGPERDALYASMLALIQAAHPARETWAGDRPGTIDDLRVAMGIESRKLLKRAGPSAFIDCGKQQVATSSHPDSAVSAAVTRLFKILADQPAWWALMPKKRRIAKLRDRAERLGAFDGQAYLKRYPDVAASGMDPLQHYLRFGYHEGRSIYDN